MRSVILYRVDPHRNMFRYYCLDVQPDLFGNECLVREWGRIGHGGQIRAIPYSTITEARKALEKHRAAKEKKGYVIAII